MILSVGCARGETYPDAVGTILLSGLPLGMQEAVAALLEGMCTVELASGVSCTLAAAKAGKPRIAVIASRAEDDAVTVLLGIRNTAPGCQLVILAPGDLRLPPSELISLGVAAVLSGSIRVGDILDRIGTLLAINTGRPSLPSLSPPVVRMVEVVSAEFGAVLRGRDIARRIGISPSYLAHRFRAETGLTVNAYVTKVRIEIAKRMLRETGDKLNTIAERVGFSDASYLSRVFREHVGCRPGQYRRRLRGAA